MSLIRTTAAERVGYDREVLSRLAPASQRQLNQLGTSWIASALILGVPVGYAAWLVEKNLLLSLALVAFVAILVVNLLRLIHSGGGTAPELNFPQEYRPSLVPAVILAGLALMLSQPAQLMLKDASAEIAVQEHREVMLAAHHASQLSLGSEPSPGFELALNQCEFILLRLRLLWAHPRSAALFSVLYCFLSLVPLYLQQAAYLKAVQAYEHARYGLARSSIHRGRALANASCEKSLINYVDYRPKGLARHLLSTPEKQA